MNENILSKLHDIKELENIPDNSIFIFSFLIFIGIFILLVILFVTFMAQGLITALAMWKNKSNENQE